MSLRPHSTRDQIANAVGTPRACMTGMTKANRAAAKNYAQQLAAQAETASDFAEVARAYRLAGCQALAERFEQRAAKLRG